MSDHTRIIIDRQAVAQHAREHRRVYCEFSDKAGIRCCATGFVASLDAQVLTLETAGRAYSIHVDRVHVLEAVGAARPAGEQKGGGT